MPPSVARRICNVFFDLSAFEADPENQGELNNIIEQVSYKPGALQRFLDEATTRLYKITADETSVILSRLRVAAEMAFYGWELETNGALDGIHVTQQSRRVTPNADVMRHWISQCAAIGCAGQISSQEPSQQVKSRQSDFIFDSLICLIFSYQSLQCQPPLSINAFLEELKMLRCFPTQLLH